jgi:hypothetical protein
MPCYVSLLICSFIGLSEYYQTSLIVDLPLFILYEHMRIIGNPFIPKCQGKNPAILILAIRTSKFGDHYMPVILRERLTVTTVA